ncbi:MAG: septal ring lytic transglycosylase RlpA family protein [Alphaproteobacteria bacterium]
MTYALRNKIGLVLGTLSTMALSFGTTATAGENYVPAAYLSASAPVTYKMTNPNMFTGNAPLATAPTFDQAAVDPNLYSHQRLGSPYTVAGQTYTPRHEPGYDMVGTASWYGDKFHGKMTASGETYDKNAMTAAHKTLPLNSYVVVTNMATGQSLKLRINDRGPFVDNRMIDLSEAAATILGYNTSGLGDVRVQYAGPAEMSVQQAYSASIASAPQQFAQLAQPQVNVPSIMAPVAIPDAYAPTTGEVDEYVTMTIKGPVHMASSKSTDAKPRFIHAVNRVTYKTKK